MAVTPSAATRTAILHPSVLGRTHKLGLMGAAGLQCDHPAGVIAALWPARRAANLDLLAVPETS
jgi:hypothetical protein